MGKLQAVFFDLDGTLVDSERAYFNGWKYAFNKEKISMDDEILKSWVGLSAKDTSKIISNHIGNSEIVPILRQHRENYFNKVLSEGFVQVKPFAYEFVNILRHQGIKLCLATSTYRERGTLILDSLGLANYFDYKIFGDQVESLKPAPEIYQKCLMHFNLSSDEAIVMEDSWAGVQAASQSNLSVFLIPDQSLIQTEVLVTDYVVGTFADFKEVYNDLLRRKLIN